MIHEFRSQERETVSASLARARRQANVRCDQIMAFSAATGRVAIPVVRVSQLSFPKTTDEALMAAYAAGDAEAFRQLFSRIAPVLHRFFVHSFADTSVADDLLQTT